MKISNFRIFVKIVKALFSKAVTLETNPKVFKPWSYKQLAFLKSLPEIFKLKPLFPPVRDCGGLPWPMVGTSPSSLCTHLTSNQHCKLLTNDYGIFQEHLSDFGPWVMLMLK